MEGVSMSEVEWTRVEDEGLVQVPYSISFSSEMSGPASPKSFGPFRRGSRSDHSQSMWGKENSTSSFFSGSRTRKSSAKSNEKGKSPMYAQDTAQEGYTSPTSSLFSFGSTDAYSQSRYQAPVHESRVVTSETHPPRKNRASFLGAASDALSFKFGRKKHPIIRQPQPMPIILPGVIEISAPRRDEEDEERNRLRETAAQAIGYPLDSRSHHDSYSLEGSEDEEEEASEGVQDMLVFDNRDANSSVHHRQVYNPRSSSASFGVINNAHSSNVSIPISPTSAVPGRHRSGSILRHARTNSLVPFLVPTFPCELGALKELKQSEILLQKFYPASSLRIFALSKNWRSRFMVLSAPTPTIKRNSSPPVSYLHLFKAASGEEKELERLEINEDSVVFVAEEDVGGRKHVVKVAGEDVGARKKELVHEEAGRTMWYLHIDDPNEAQMWITSIKSAILSQRTIRAGLGVAGNTVNGIEPRGDMDVMLSMRAQGLISSPSTPTTARPSTASAAAYPQSDRNSISSNRSQATVSKTLSAGIKGLFVGSTRPRSASRATSIDTQHDKDSVVDESFTSRGTHLMRATDPASPAQPTSRHMHISHTVPPEHRIDRKIMPDRINFWAAEPPTTTSAAKERANRTLSLQGSGIALQPPPRKRWTSVGPSNLAPIVGSTNVFGRLSPLGDAGIHEQEPEPSSPKVSVFHSPEHSPREPSILSVSTIASAEAPMSEDQTFSGGTKRSSRRWSRQGVLPRRLTPPSGPPPAAPLPSNPGSSRSQLSAPSMSDRRLSQSSTQSSASRQSGRLASFSKRASGSSFLSLSGPGHSQSPPISRPTSSHSHRMSMPPPRPAPNSALPPAPVNKVGEENLLGDVSPLASSQRSNKRESTSKAFRLSMLAQKLPAPPASALPPRPKEAQRPKGNRRNSSADVYGRRTHRNSLDMIPASPIPSSLVLAPFPPPNGPLPPTPASRDAAAAPTTSRQSSLKKRLRILSAPSSSQGGSGSKRRSLPPTPLNLVPTVQTVQVGSPLATPIAERIAPNQDDPSFLQINTPPMLSLPPPPSLSRPLPEPEVLVIPLSPPPRRGSRHIVPSELIASQERKSSEGEHRLKAVSRPGSVISLGIVSM